MPPENRLSFPKSSTRGAPASSKASAKSSASNGSPYAARRPRRTSPPSSPSPACLSWSNPSTRPKATLGDALKKLEEIGISLHPALKSAFSQLYGYTSDASGIRHSLLAQSVLDLEDAKLMLVLCSAFVNFLKARNQA